MGKRAGCFALFVFLVPRDCCVALPHDATVCLQFVIVVFPDHTHLLCLMPMLSGLGLQYGQLSIGFSAI